MNTVAYREHSSFTDCANQSDHLQPFDLAATLEQVAHSSSSVNNPYFAAYDCGACSGKPGAPNARVFAWTANHETVRALLRERGIDIPDATRFVAALHNTSTDEITYFDMHLLEQHPARGLHTFQNSIKKVLQRNTRERCRWFELGPQSPSNQKAHEHVMERASSIFEPRPEYNHSNNLYCIVGRRTLTQDLFLSNMTILPIRRSTTGLCRKLARDCH